MTWIGELCDASIAEFEATAASLALADLVFNRRGDSYADWLESLRRAAQRKGDDGIARWLCYQAWVHTFLAASRAEPYPTVSSDPQIQAYYVACRLDDTSHSLAEMFATGMVPQIRTDNTFMEGFCNGNQFEGEEDVGDYYKAIATAQGIDVTGAVYKSGLAAYPGDPRAWVRTRADVKEICEERGLGSFGSVNLAPAFALEEPAKVRPATDIVQSRMEEAIEKNPDLIHGDLGELYHDCEQSLTPNWTEPVPEPVD